MDPRSMLMPGGAPPDPSSQLPAGPFAGASAPDSSAPGDLHGPEILTAMLQLATLYRAQESDHGDLLKMERASTLIQQILADHQSQHDQLLGGNASALRRLAG